MRTFCLLVLFVLGCGGDGEGEDPPAVDAPSNLPACTGAAYDPCTDNSQCMSMNCRVFDSAGIQICTQSCDASNPCPDFMGQPVACNNKGRCNPRGQNACMP